MKRYSNISYLRVLACLGIVVTHLWQRLNLGTGKIYELTHYLQHGVYLFFIISGFLAVYTYMSKEYKAVDYWVKRLIRILPVYYAIVIYNIIVHGFILKDMPPDAYGLGWARYFLIIHQFVPGETQWRNISFTWTISVIVLFYLLVPLVSRLVKSYRSSIVSLAGTYIATVVLQKLYGMAGISTDWCSPLFYITYFMIGVVIYHAVNEKKVHNAIVLFSVMMLYYFASSKFNSPYTLSFLFAIIMLASMDLKFSNKYIQKTFDSIDRYSYEIYLGHAVIMEGIDIIGTYVTLSVPATCFIAIVGTVLICLILYHGVDRPVTALMKKCSGMKDSVKI